MYLQSGRLLEVARVDETGARTVDTEEYAGRGRLGTLRWMCSNRSLTTRGYAIAREVLAVEPLGRLMEALLALDILNGPGGDSSCFENLSPSDWGPLPTMVSHPLVMERWERLSWDRVLKMSGDCGRLVRPGLVPARARDGMPTCRNRVGGGGAGVPFPRTTQGCRQSGR